MTSSSLVILRRSGMEVFCPSNELGTELEQFQLILIHGDASKALIATLDEKELAFGPSAPHLRWAMLNHRSGFGSHCFVETPSTNVLFSVVVLTSESEWLPVFSNEQKLVEQTITGTEVALETSANKPSHNRAKKPARLVRRSSASSKSDIVQRNLGLVSSCFRPCFGLVSASAADDSSPEPK
ncbi:hypothetical protein O181_036484 [Austropuccinia psidii MF-1]|uniref:Uncharacterized protein n=1 Tax=Austropuccinia psidii MF-1 TaxID=1389203 RepID=A0A9Q3D4R6_9BASI|nr:hypothetical protein [Austropuccinia psidii MF-1]